MVADTDRTNTHAESPNRTPNAERRIGVRDRLSRVIVDAVADALDCEQTEVPPLHASVDPEALDDLFGPRYDGTPRTCGRVEFTHDECEVRVARELVRVYRD